MLNYILFPLIIGALLATLIILIVWSWMLNYRWSDERIGREAEKKYSKRLMEKGIPHTKVKVDQILRKNYTVEPYQVQIRFTIINGSDVTKSESVWFRLVEKECIEYIDVYQASDGSYKSRMNGLDCILV